MSLTTSNIMMAMFLAAGFGIIYMAHKNGQSLSMIPVAKQPPTTSTVIPMPVSNPIILNGRILSTDLSRGAERLFSGEAVY